MSRDSIEADRAFVESLETSLWIELATEYDAENFCEHLRRRVEAGRLSLSGLFSRFEQIWRRDELNHTHGFARLYSTLYSVGEEEIFEKLKARQPDFNSIEPFLEDEFAICLVLAFDEIATTKSYQSDMVVRYPKFGNPALVDWIRLVARDEAWHFNNALTILKQNHSHRIEEIPSFLDQLVSFDFGRGEYGSTFVLDHSANDYSPALLDSCRTLILRRFDFVEPEKQCDATLELKERPRGAAEIRPEREAEG